MEHVHRTRCERGRDVLVSAITGEVVRARCKSWRECQYCAWVYGSQVERLFKQVKRLRAFVVLTMPPELGDPFNRDHLMAQAKALRRLAERLLRRFGHRFSTLWTREHNTKRGAAGRLHLNLLWDEEWVDQAWLSEAATACGSAELSIYRASVKAGGTPFDPGEGAAKPSNAMQPSTCAIRARIYRVRPTGRSTRGVGARAAPRERK